VLLNTDNSGEEVYVQGGVKVQDRQLWQTARDTCPGAQRYGRYWSSWFRSRRSVLIGQLYWRKRKNAVCSRKKHLIVSLGLIRLGFRTEPFQDVGNVRTGKWVRGQIGHEILMSLIMGQRSGLWSIDPFMPLYLCSRYRYERDKAKCI